MFPAELQKRERLNGGRPGRDVGGNRTNGAFSGAEPRELLGVTREFGTRAREEGKRLGGMSQLSLFLPPIPEGHDEVPMLPMLIVLAESDAALASERDRLP